MLTKEKIVISSRKLPLVPVAAQGHEGVERNAESTERAQSLDRGFVEKILCPGVRNVLSSTVGCFQHC